MKYLRSKQICHESKTDNKHGIVTTRCMNQFKILQFCDELDITSWDPFHNADVNKSVEYFRVSFTDVLNKHAPITERQVKYRSKPVRFTDETCELINLRDRAKCKRDWTNYKLLRNRVVKLIKQAKKVILYKKYKKL